MVDQSSGIDNVKKSITQSPINAHSVISLKFLRPFNFFLNSNLFAMQEIILPFIILFKIRQFIVYVRERVVFRSGGKKRKHPIK